MHKTDRLLAEKLDRATIQYQNEILGRLKLFKLSKDAILFFCENHYKEMEDYDFKEFKDAFKLIQFQDQKEIKNIKYEDIKDYGKNFIQNELSDSLFVLNMSTFENWLFTILKLKYVDDKKEFSRILSGNRENKINPDILVESSTIEEVWESLIDNHLRNTRGIKNIITKLITILNFKKSDLTHEIIEKINENSLCRNIIVHNKKIIDDNYIKNSGKFAKFKKSDVIVIDEILLFQQGDNLIRFMQDIRKLINRDIQ